MKTMPSRCQAFSLGELVVVIAVLSVLAVLLARAQVAVPEQALANRIHCVNQLKQVGLAFRMWSNDNGDKFPMRVEGKKGGTLEAIKQGEAARHFQILSNELGQTKVLACPSDIRKPAEDFAKLSNANLSYFVGLDADEAMPQTILSGDRNLTNGLPIHSGILALGDEPAAGWTEELHNQNGNLGLADGGVQQVTVAALRRQITAGKPANNKDAVIRIQLPIAGSGSD